MTRHPVYPNSCSTCLDNEPDMCSLIREGVMAAPTEFSREVGGDDDNFTSQREHDLDEKLEEIPKFLPYGSTALIRVEAAENHGQDIVPVLVARKAVSPWSTDYARDNMFTPGDMMLWILDLKQVVPEEGEGLRYEVPDEVGVADKYRAVPLTCIAGLGQGLAGYMDKVTRPESVTGCQHYVLKTGVVEDARSNVVLLSTNPASAFKGFQPLPLSDEDIERSPLRKKMFLPRTKVSKSFKGPYTDTGRRRWRSPKVFEAEVKDIRTDEKSRRHRYLLQWEGDARELKDANVRRVRKVDEGFVEKYAIDGGLPPPPASGKR